VSRSELAVTSFLNEISHTIVPPRGSEHGPLSSLLLSMTLVTGLVDAFSYLVLGHVFVANMTGNVVLLGFALVGAPGFSVSASLVAIGAFVAGSVLGGRAAVHLGAHRARHFAAAAGVQTFLLALATLVAAVHGRPVSGAWHYVVIVVLAVSMGIQNATARKLAVPDLTTTVLTLTITGVGADSRIAGGPGAHAGRRVLAVATMLAGAVAGAALILHTDIAYPLLIATAVTGGAALAAVVSGRSDPPWVRLANAGA
jgi:uncharacterized membrane protein YoaK (UPF0700 family)